MLNLEKQCTGCGACVEICPVGCIIMQKDAEGFRYAIVDQSACIGCNKCEKRCPVLNHYDVSSETTAVAAKRRNEVIRLSSSSGGVFSALAESILDEGGAVCAAKYSDDFSVVHEITERKEDIPKYRGAKYAQSQSEHCFPGIKRMLDSGHPVLYVGTPCQTLGLSAYLGKEYDRLYLADMICHGVPSPKVWKKYLNERCLLDGGNLSVKNVNMRCKSTGWSHYSYSMEVVYQNGEYYLSQQEKDPFMRGFVGNLYLRPSCAQCKFKGVERCSDFTLGDYWGIWEQDPEFDDNKGVSVVLIHSEKAKERWKYVEPLFDVKQISTDQAVQYNPSALVCSRFHPKRKEFFDRFEKEKSVVSLIEDVLGKNKIRKSWIKRVRKHLKF